MMQCSELGPFWVKQFTEDLQQKRNAGAKMAARCAPGGQYRAQIEMAVRQMDVALAAPALLVALENCLKFLENDAFSGLPSEPEINQARLAIVEAKGKP